MEAGDYGFAVNKDHAAGGVTATEDEVKDAMGFAFRELKLVVEPSGAVPLAALLAGRLDVKGKVVAVVGWITNERSLGGVINAADGTPLAFVFYALGDVISSDTKQALDTLATAAYTCGDNLSNN